MLLTRALQGNSWQQISPSGTAPVARYDHTGAWSDTADGMYIFSAGGAGWGPLTMKARDACRSAQGATCGSSTARLAFETFS